MNIKKDFTPKLSVLVTFHNQREYIEKAFNSIIMQKTNFSYEVLIGTDDFDKISENIINKYVERYPFIKLYKIDNRNIETIGIEKASRNRINLINNAKGEYFCMLDGDDSYADETRFQKLVDFLDKYPEIIGIAHDHNIYNDKNSETFDKTSFYKREQLITPEVYIKMNAIPVWCFIFRNIFYGNFPSDYPKHFFNDSTIVYYMLNYGNFYYIPDIMISYRIGCDSIFTARTKLEQLLSALLAIEVNHTVIPAYEKIYCQTKKRIIIKCIRYLLKNKNSEQNPNLKQIEVFASKHSYSITARLWGYKTLSGIECLRFCLDILSYLLFYTYCKT